MSFIWDERADQIVQSMLKTHSVEEIARAIGCGRSTCYNRINGKKFTPEYREKQSCEYRAKYPARDEAETVDPRPSADLIRDRDARALLPCRDLTGLFFGDPRVGESALDVRARSAS